MAFSRRTRIHQDTREFTPEYSQENRLCPVHPKNLCWKDKRKEDVKDQGWERISLEIEIQVIVV
jgi:hypothetical protein